MAAYNSAQTTIRPEPTEAFPYKPPCPEVLKQFQTSTQFRRLDRERTLKFLLDKMLAVAALIFLSPVIILLLVLYVLESVFDPSSRGPFIYYYFARSAGAKFKKYKFRQMKVQFIDQSLASSGSWHAYSKEWSPECLTKVGRLVKLLYLDELPQLFNVLVGDMSFVGPRALACHHYERDVAQGNVFRALLRAGLLGPSQALKGSAQFGDPAPEFEYLKVQVSGSQWQALMLDFKLLYSGILVIFRRRGA